MKFYDRKKELKLINGFIKNNNRARILVLTGRRRIGKTRLAIETVKDRGLYFFTKKKGINDLLNEWTNEIKKKYDYFGKFNNFEEFLNYLFKIGEKEPLVVIFDEIQNILHPYPEAFSTIQKVFDLRKESSKLLIIFTGSTYTLIENIFKNSKEPLFGRASEIMKLSYFPITKLEEILKDYGLFNGENLLHLYSIFDGVPYYIEEFLEVNKKSFKGKLEALIRDREILWEEGENLLRMEMGKEYSVYYSILSAISKGKRTRNEISQFIGIRELGGYIRALEKTYNLIERRVSVFKNRDSKLSRYYIKDNFLDFWFNLIDKYRNYKELGKREIAFKRIWEELPVFEGRKLEKLVLNKIMESNEIDFDFTIAGGFWDRQGINEIDLVLANKEKRIAYLFEIKRNGNKILKKSLEFLKQANQIIGELSNYKTVICSAWIDKTGVKIKIGY